MIHDYSGPEGVVSSKKEDKPIFEGIRKPTAPPSQRYKTRKGTLDRKRKHKGKDEE